MHSNKHLYNSDFAQLHESKSYCPSTYTGWILYVNQNVKGCFYKVGVILTPCQKLTETFNHQYKVINSTLVAH